MQEHIITIVENTERSIPLFVYHLVDYDGEQIVSSAPIIPHGYVSVRLTDNRVLVEKKVLRVFHLNEPQNVGRQILTPFITLEP